VSLAAGFALEFAKFGAIALAYVVGLAVLFPGGGTVVAGLLCAFFTSFLINVLKESLIPSADQRAITRALRRIPPVEGERTAISGPLVPIESSLISPLGGSPCVAYRYAIATRVSSSEAGSSLSKCFRGFANSPCAVQTERGPVRIRGLDSTDLDLFDERRLHRAKALARARAYVSTTHFEPDPGHRLSAALPALRQRFAGLADPQLASRHDYGDPQLELAPSHEFLETVIPAGQIVTAIGDFSSDGPELKPRGVHLLTLLPGDLEASIEDTKPGLYVVGVAFAMFVMAHVILATAIHGGAFD